ncbi:MAG: hypothetical protein R2794_13985, partial [Chitinophagales bacterium]
MKTLLIIIVSLLSIRLFAQSPEIIWAHNFGGTSLDDQGKIVRLLDTTYLIAGRSSSNDVDLTNNYGFTDIWVAKVDTNTNIIWQKNFGGSSSEFLGDLISLSDGNYLIGGASGSSDFDVTYNHGSIDIWLVKISPDGDILWQLSIGGTDGEYVHSIIEANDGNIYFTGESASDDGDIGVHYGVDTWDAIYGKVSGSGVLQWVKVVGTNNEDEGNQVIQLNYDNNFLIVGTTGYLGSNKYWIRKFDPDGNMIWDRYYGGSNYDNAESVYELSGHNLIVTGQSYSFDGNVTGHHGSDYADVWTIKLDKNGDFLQGLCFGGSLTDIGNQIAEGEDATSLLIVCETTSQDDGDVSGIHSHDLTPDI